VESFAVHCIANKLLAAIDKHTDTRRAEEKGREHPVHHEDGLFSVHVKHLKQQNTGAMPLCIKRGKGWGNQKKVLKTLSCSLEKRRKKEKEVPPKVE
jgi:hypothetical protein